MHATHTEPYLPLLLNHFHISLCTEFVCSLLCCVRGTEVLSLLQVPFVNTRNHILIHRTLQRKSTTKRMPLSVTYLLVIKTWLRDMTEIMTVESKLRRAAESFNVAKHYPGRVISPHSLEESCDLCLPNLVPSPSKVFTSLAGINCCIMERRIHNVQYCILTSVFLYLSYYVTTSVSSRGFLAYRRCLDVDYTV